MRPSQTFQVLEDLRNTFVGPLHRKGIELSFNDSQTAKDVYQQWLLLMVDLDYLHPESLSRQAHGLFTDLVKADVLDLNNAFADLLHLVRCKNFKGFKALCSRISSHLYNLIKVDSELAARGDVMSAGRLVQLFSYTSRLTLHEIDLSQQCIEDYMEIEDEMSSYLPKGLTSSLSKIIREWMEPFDPSRIKFRHGPGGVAGHGRVPYEVKYKDLTYDKRLTYAFGEPYWSTEPIRSELDRISHTIFVPKSYKTFRTISMESSTLQFTQQGVWREIDRVVRSSHRLRSRIGFQDQVRNQLLAREGSISRNYATIDLSSASDSVSYALVKKLFRRTKLLRFLVATRSSRTLLPDGRLIDLKKFAPMGSALCFPIETLIFAAICHYVTREHGVTGDYSVYGDDIIVPTQCVEDLMITLEILGFRVNKTKSFYQDTCWFRESCGAEYVAGYDVTPMRVSREYNHTQRLVQTTSLVDLANAAYLRGFRNLRSFFVRKLQNSEFTPLYAPTSLMSDNYTNYHTRRRWNSDLQRMECETSSLVSSPPVDQDESIRYRHWLESTADREKVDLAFISIVGRETVFVKERWNLKPYETADQPYIDFNLQREGNLPPS